MIGIAVPTSIARFAERLEADGFAGLAVVDSQNLSGDTYVSLALAARATSRLGLATGVTNPYTRHPAVTASAIASVQAVSGGRAVLGIGRGDSALAHLGLAPAPVAVFEAYLRRLQGYLRGEDVAFDDAGDVASVDALGLGDQPAASRLEWIAGLPKVPVDVAATGPRVIELAARLADGITFAVGADAERLEWAIATARAAAPAGSPLSFGAYVNVAVHPDVDVARRLVAGGMSTLARFNVMHGRTVGPFDAGSEAMLGELGRRYDMTRHTQSGSPQAEALAPEFIDRYGVVGPPDAVIERLGQLRGLGIERFMLLGAWAPGLEAERRVARRLLADEVIPALA
jgi:5,10-methylenetetrahydromethanopterin reductase